MVRLPYLLWNDVYCAAGHIMLSITVNNNPRRRPERNKTGRAMSGPACVVICAGELFTAPTQP